MEEDKIKIMSMVMSKAWYFHRIEHDLKDILKKLRIFRGYPRMEFHVRHRWEPECFVYATIPAENNVFGKDVDIIIKPDHSRHRVLRFTVDMAGEVKTNSEDKDNPHLSDKEVFKKELEAVEKDIEKELNKIKERQTQVA